MKQKLIFTLVAASLAGTALASQQEESGSGNMRDTNGTAQEQVALNEARLREHFIRVAELAGFEVLGTSNPDGVALNEMVLTVRPQAERVTLMSNHYNKGLYSGNEGGKWGDSRRDDDDD